MIELSLNSDSIKFRILSKNKSKNSLFSTFNLI